MKWQNNSTGLFYDANESTVVYFDSHSGDTHLLSDFAAYVIQQIGRQSLSTEELVDQISLSIDPDNIPNLSETVLSVVEELVTLDILKRA